jgi:hypothetical protein
MLDTHRALYRRVLMHTTVFVLCGIMAAISVGGIAAILWLVATGKIKT